MSEYTRKEHYSLIRDLNTYAIAFHESRRCKCMSRFTEKITQFNYIPCKHLNKAQWKKFKNRINELDEVYQEEWHNKLYSAISNQKEGTR